MSSFDDFVKKNTIWLENEYVAGALTLFLIIYAHKAAPSLPSYMSTLFSNSIFKVIMFFLIVYMYNKKASVAFISALALMFAIMIMDKIDVKTTEKMIPLTDNQNDLFTNLNKLINDALDFVTSTEGQIAMEETTRAVQEGHLHPAEAEMIINKIILAEEQGMSPLVAMSEQGAQEMSNIAQAVENGQIASEEGQRLAAQIVIQENVLNIAPNEQLPVAKQLCAQIELDYHNQKMSEMLRVTELTEFNGFNGFDDFAPLYEEF